MLARLHRWREAPAVVGAAIYGAIGLLVCAAWLIWIFRYNSDDGPDGADFAVAAVCGLLWPFALLFLAIEIWEEDFVLVVIGLVVSALVLAGLIAVLR